VPVVINIDRKHHFEQVWVSIYGNDLRRNWKFSMLVRFILRFTNALVIIIMRIMIIIYYH